MRILALPRESTNPYQELLYQEMRRRGARITYLGELTPSHTLNLLLLPLEMAIRRLGGARVVHLHWIYAFGLYASDRSRAVRLAAEAWFTAWLWVLRLLDMRLVWTAHNVLPQAPAFADDIRGRRRLVGACDLVIAHSKATLEQLAALGIVARRSAVIPHGPFREPVESTWLRTPGDGQQTRQLLYFGKIRPYKGVDTLLDVFAALPPETDAHLTVAGECSDSSHAVELSELASKSRGRVTLRLEWVSDEEVSRLLHLADAVVLPYRKITTSGSGLLALCHGRPLIVPDLPGLAELPDDAVVRYDGTAQGLSHALSGIIQADAAMLSKMSSAAYAYCAAMSWTEIAERTLAEIAECLNQDASAAKVSTLSIRDAK
jgi:glycosyltransferase involved in cell wall biosynthesis